MASASDSNEVLLTGENSFIRLTTQEDEPATTRASHWRVLLSPGGSGHALFLKSDLTDDQVRVYSDNIAVARWLQEEIESLLFPEFADQTIPVLDAVFGRSGEGMSFWTETVESDDESINLTWYDFAEPFMIRVEAGSVPGRPHGVYSCIVPAARAQVTLDGRVASGDAFQREHGGRPSSSCCLALSETWVRPHRS